MKKMVVFDLDFTLIDSGHRTPHNKDGSVNIKKFLELATPENIRKDTLLPLASEAKMMYNKGFYVVICTSRMMTQADYDFLEDNGIKYHELLERNTTKHPYWRNLTDDEYKMKQLKKFRDIFYTFFDDNESIIEKFSQYVNVKMVDAKKVHEIVK